MLRLATVHRLQMRTDTLHIMYKLPLDGEHVVGAP